ncbi:MAG TPA: TMEM165/GDT1 family protein [bacterium]|jgi:putative Ca2+/H+ antiporter (TMEM165/GDT1 family)|nr:TMEM165/GDT1 family protein [bacterium]
MALPFPFQAALSVILACFLLVFVSEMGDKTQLMTLVLTTRYKRPWTVLAGVLVASLANLGLVAWLGTAISARINPMVLKWVVGLSFFGFAAWMLVPEKDEDLDHRNGYGAFLTTAVSIFVAEMGDKAQFAVLALGARYADPLRVTIGGVLGMVTADSLAVAFGGRLTAWVPMVWVRRAASLLFFLFGLILLLRS